eukprot:12209-Heterococcus_DN1.PRE.1
MSLAMLLGCKQHVTECNKTPTCKQQAQTASMKEDANKFFDLHRVHVIIASCRLPYTTTLVNQYYLNMAIAHMHNSNYSN